MEGVSPSALALVQRLPAPVQEALQTALMNSLQDPYYPALATLPLAFGLAYVPHTVALGVKVAQNGLLRYNNDTPRTEKLEKYPKLLARAVGAHNNALEMFPAFAAAVLAARMRKGDPARLAALCLQYLKLRLAYTALYLCGVNPAVNAARTAAWMMMLRCLAGLYGLSLA